MLTPDYRGKYLILMKAAQANGTLHMMKKIYLARLIADRKKEKAAEATAALNESFKNFS